VDNKPAGGFSGLTPDIVLSAVEESLGTYLTGLITPFPSYINRVYEVETDADDRFVVKFYRPGRWTPEALIEEHEFISDCASMDIPVVAPVSLKSCSVSGSIDTLGKFGGFYFAVFPKRSGRLFELNGDEDYLRAGALAGRIHLAGRKRSSAFRTVIDPVSSSSADIEEILSGPFISGSQKEAFRAVTDDILKLITPLFEGVERFKIHGDFHTGNIITRPDGDGAGNLMVIDFDDMAVGPPVQDLLLLLPGSITDSRREFNLLVEGYEQFLPFDRSSVKLVEPLRAMRIIYFLAWSARQIDDYQFRSHFPGWGTEGFWEKEIQDLRNQLLEIRESL